MESHRLEDRIEIEELVARYNRFCDRNYNPDGLASLFVEDGVWRALDRDGHPDFGECHGVEEIHALFSDFSARGLKALHLTTNPEIDFEGECDARGIWSSLTVILDGSGIRVRSSFRHDRYVKTVGGWRFRERVTQAILDMAIDAS